MKNTSIIISLFCLLTINVNAQVGLGTQLPNTASILEINTTNKGILFNKLQLTSTNSPSPLSNHQEGLWVYNTESAGTTPNEVYPGLYYNDGTKWILLSTDISHPRIGDIKANVAATEHNGWYLLNGRAVSTLPTNARLNAINIGIITNLPDSTDRILKGIAATEVFAITGGNSNIVLTQANLPNITYSGSVNSVLDHTHNFTSYANSTWNHNNGSALALRNLATETRTTNPAGAHSHTVTIPTGGTATPIVNYPRNLTTQYFIYLGN
ncbi:hypothetical protein SAMN05443634_106181 [Chishuiella changwenlii]|uniref:Microcystin-dependent protein n=1 Tax=Chishuiella changwenlii TaxID=1434701 RepID=A0A1M6YCG3_9FLAO|nr:hypothetical protein [Chishuiella changwenlii]GGE97781.1 hypothetical protein GCM10010984_14170 [Chishuiella changwenlii]SHL15715.1 hypothetical protein SAMN05443634_106181 [Chishuiella changwenlii]